MNWGASLGQGSEQGNVAAPSQSHLDPTDLLSRGRSASCSPMQRGRTIRPIQCFIVGEAQHRVQKFLEKYCNDN